MGRKKKKKRFRGHYCWCCGGMKPNEQFSGRGHRDHICKTCQKKPTEERQKIRDERFVGGVLEQKSISAGNIKTLEQIGERYTDSELGRSGTALAQVGRIKPGRKKRMGTLYFNHRELYDELVVLGLIWDTITPRLEEERMCEGAYKEWAADHEDDAALDSWLARPYREQEAELNVCSKLLDALPGNFFGE